ncbi:MAG TPA: hypothetical protein VLE96_04900 [Chlamydiales bacterium]|nr:hypothetical protein [Chlamydiales bacterium]
MKRIAVVTASGLGDGLIFHIFSHNLTKAGFDVVTFNPHLPNFGKWLHGYQFATDDLFEGFDAIILQHDNSAKHERIKQLKKKVYCFYGSHQEAKHGALKASDFVCDLSKTIVENTQTALRQWFGLHSLENGLTPPQGLTFRKYPKRVVIHPDSSNAEKNWPSERYKLVADALKKAGYHPVFITEENRPLFPKLEDLASFIYESGAFLGTDSGPGHLASYLHIPTVTIASCPKHMLHWRPGWGYHCVITPPSFVTYFKYLRSKWKSFINTKYVIKLSLNHINNYN